MNPLARVTVDENGPVVIVHLEGEVDLSNVEEIRTLLVDAVVHETECMILDLTKTTYLDSTGVRLVFELAERMQGRRQQLRVVIDDDAVVKRVVVLTQLDQRVPLDSSVDDALSALGQG